MQNKMCVFGEAYGRVRKSWSNSRDHLTARRLWNGKDVSRLSAVRCADLLFIRCRPSRGAAGTCQCPRAPWSAWAPQTGPVQWRTQCRRGRRSRWPTQDGKPGCCGKRGQRAGLRFQFTVLATSTCSTSRQHYPPLPSSLLHPAGPPSSTACAPPGSPPRWCTGWCAQPQSCSCTAPPG